ncbi:MAG: DUF177 domain-containing protein [Candidatus Omnitrophica bacterium]|nr:DUF177 domain-containing protein [Candidatus Omnitrophota bacterium]
MIIDLTHIKDEEEISLAHEYDPKHEELEFVDYRYTTGITLEGTALRQNDSVSVTGVIKWTCVITCSRCVKEFNSSVDEHFDFSYDVYDKKQIDITNDVREQVIFLHEQQYLCRPDCKGLCPTCGNNLNTGQCTCSHNEIRENKFSQLKEILHDKKKEK